MKNDEAKASSKPEWQRYCHACAHPLTEGIETCPECDSPVVDVDELLELARRKESPESKRARRRKEMALVFDIYCSAFIMLVLVSSLLVVSRILQLEGAEGSDHDEIIYWIGGYGILVVLALAALIRIDRVNIRYHLERLKK